MDQTTDHLSTVGCRVLWLGGPEQSPRSPRGLLVEGQQKSSSSSRLGDSESRTLPERRGASSFVEGRGDPKPNGRDDCSIQQPFPARATAPNGNDPTSRGAGASESQAEIPCHTVPGDCQRLNGEGTDQARSIDTPRAMETEEGIQGSPSASTRSVLDVPEAMPGMAGLSGVVSDSSELLLRSGVCSCVCSRQRHFCAQG